MPVCVKVCCLRFWFYILQFSSIQKVSGSSTPGLLHDRQSVGTTRKFALHVHSWSALKNWGRCTFKTIVYNKWLMLNFTSWHCPVRTLLGISPMTNCVAFMVLWGITGDLRKFSVIGFCIVCFMQVYWLMTCSMYITAVLKLWIPMLYK